MPVSDGVATLVGFDAESMDRGDYFDPAVSETDIVIPQGVLAVDLCASIFFGAIDNGAVVLKMLKNGADFDGQGFLQVEATPSGPDVFQVHAMDIACSPGDIFTLEVTQNSGGTRQILGGNLSNFTVRATA